MTYHRFFNKSSMTGATCGAGTVYSSGAQHLRSAPVFSGLRATRSLVFMFCCSLFVLLSFSFGHFLRFTTSNYPFGIFKLFLIDFLQCKLGEFIFIMLRTVDTLNRHVHDCSFSWIISGTSVKSGVLNQLYVSKSPSQLNVFHKYSGTLYIIYLFFVTYKLSYV